MTAEIIHPAQWRDRFEVRLERVLGVSYAGATPAAKWSWEVGLYTAKGDYVDPLAFFKGGEREAAIEWAQAHITANPSLVYGGIVG